MNRKIFYSIIAVMLLVFFALSVGGCGSDTHDYFYNEETDGNGGNGGTNTDPSNGGGSDTNTTPTDTIGPDDVSSSSGTLDSAIATLIAAIEVPDPTDTAKPTPSAVNGNGEVSAKMAMGVNVALDLETEGDSDGDNKLDIIDFDGVEQLYAPEAGTIVSGEVPLMMWMDALPSQSSPDVIVTSFAAGVEYTVEFSKNLAEPLGGRMADIEIYGPDGKILPTEVTVYPDGEPSMILHTFTPTATGKHVILICNANGNTDSNTETDSVVFVYKEMKGSDGQNGYFSRFVIKNEDGETYSEMDINEIIQLRKKYLEVNGYFLDEVYGSDNAEGGRNRNAAGVQTEESEGYNDFMDILNYKAGYADEGDDDDFADPADEAEAASFRGAATGGKTQIDTTIYGVPYEDGYELGAGFSAITNLQPLTGTALESFTVPVPTAKTGSTHFTYSFITSKEDYEQKMGKNFSLSGAKAAVGGSLSVQSTNNMKFSLTSTTLIIHYEELENTYRTLPSLKDYKFNEDAQELIDAIKDGEEDPNEFRKEYGDYFVAGYQYGGMYEAKISITTNTTEQLEKLKVELSAQLNKASEDVSKTGTSGSLSFGSESQETMNRYKAQITVDIRTIGAGSTTPQIVALDDSKDIASMGKVASELSKFRDGLASSFTPATYAPVNVLLRRYRSLTGMRSVIDGYIPIDPNHSANIMTFNGQLVALRGYWNVIGTLPRGVMDGEVQDDYRLKFDTLVNPIRAGGNAFYESADRIAKTLPQVVALAKEIKQVGDRYTFYRMLVDAQEKEVNLAGTEITSKPFGENGGSTGYKSFGVSAAVTSDIAKGKSDTKKHHTKLNIGWDEWKPEFNAGEDYRNCWFEITAPHDKDNVREVLNAPAVGKQRSQFRFQAGYDRDGDWDVRYQTIYMPRSLYPFSGLKD